ncbi:hypothetical protein Tdes44962_MAKER09887 [Teratosphaeria destructans]|uniref:Uncharacterized protein n=1 Tax=Teratosphaeria destructans TaxID=418781 RepID=A0A9W7SQX5_9PEZI|nr:hypothetical protein Tdes44962_MAKER09887 [Teratosphaeria destructans]
MARQKQKHIISPEAAAAGIDTNPQPTSVQLVNRPASTEAPDLPTHSATARKTDKTRGDLVKNAKANMYTPSAATDRSRRIRTSDSSSRPSTAGGLAESASANTAGAAAAVDDDEDTIAVNTKSHAAPTAHHPSPSSPGLSLTGTNKPGKKPVQNSPRPSPFTTEPMTGTFRPQDMHDNVDEGSVDYNDVRSEDLDDPYDPTNDPDAQSHVSIESDDTKHTVEQAMTIDIHLLRPWRVSGFSPEMRRTRELMYYNLETRPIGGDYAYTELYQEHKDKEMLRYLQDYPLDQWVIPRGDAEQAYLRMLERTRWRHLGIPIYGNQRIPEMIPHSTPDFRPNGPGAPQMPPNMRSQPGRPGSVPQQHMAYPPPQQMLRSQPHAQPMNVKPGQLYTHHGPPVPPGQIPPGLPPPPPGMMYAPHPYPLGLYPQQYPPQGPHAGTQRAQATPTAPTGGKRKNQTPQPLVDEQPDALPDPPYQPAPRPAVRKVANRNGRASSRKPAEADTLPWHRKMDFHKAKAAAAWDENEYDPNVLNGMAETRRSNMAVMSQLDDELAEKQRQQRARRTAAKKTQANDSPSSDAEYGSRAGSAKPGHRENVGGDPYHSGNYAFASQADVVRAAQIGKHSPDDIIDAAESGEIDWNLCKHIMICWNPGKKGTTQDLKQGIFRVYDTLITRKQLLTRDFLTRRAAECIIDFCPDLLWRETLLRIVSEGGMGNKDVRDRFCLNGCHCDKATITKRIAAAIGQKQKSNPRRAASGEAGVSSPQPGRYLKGEAEWHITNQKQYYNYINWCGTRHGTSVKVGTGAKRSSEDLESPPAKRARSEYELESADAGDTTEEESEQEIEQQTEEKDDDAVSIQSDTLLDEMED